MTDKDELNGLLDQWKGVPAMDPQIKHKVWTRIAAADSNETSNIPDWLNGLASALSQPLGVSVFFAACIGIGLLTAEIRVSKAKSVQLEELAQNYVHLVVSQAKLTEGEAIK
ncbi:MAG: hypothetical protein O3C43_20675 [Verrucomicrobia bacterium]|nr:hypothetical protein [Verrucomicrobiota bacterium]MDA1068908.1 hypothetical protein [Verrucomicrobiota bacterium]